MKSRQWLVTLGLLVLVLAALVGLILTSDHGVPETTQSSRSHRRPLVDESAARDCPHRGQAGFRLG